MNEVAADLEKSESEILHYYYFRNTSVKLVKNDGKYQVIMKKYILYLFKKRKNYEFTSFHEAEDKYLEIKSILQYQGRFN